MLKPYICTPEKKKNQTRAAMICVVNTITAVYSCCIYFVTLAILGHPKNNVTFALMSIYHEHLNSTFTQLFTNKPLS